MASRSQSFCSFLECCVTAFLLDLPSMPSLSCSGIGQVGVAPQVTIGWVVFERLRMMRIFANRSMQGVCVLLFDERLVGWNAPGTIPKHEISGTREIVKLLDVHLWIMTVQPSRRSFTSLVVRPCLQITWRSLNWFSCSTCNIYQLSQELTPWERSTWGKITRFLYKWGRKFAWLPIIMPLPTNELMTIIK